MVIKQLDDAGPYGSTFWRRHASLPGRDPHLWRFSMGIAETYGDPMKILKFAGWLKSIRIIAQLGSTPSFGRENPWTRENWTYQISLQHVLAVELHPCTIVIHGVPTSSVTAPIGPTAHLDNVQEPCWLWKIAEALCSFQLWWWTQLCCFLLESAQNWCLT